MKVTYLERAPGSWRLRIERGRDAQGRRLFSYVTVRGTEDDAKRRRYELLTAHEAGAFVVPDKVTLGQFLDRWIDSRFALGTIGRSSAETYRMVANTYVKPELGGMRLQMVRGADLQALYTKLLTVAKLSRTTVAQVHRILTPAFKSARKARLITLNPIDEVDAPTRGRTKPRAIEGEKLDRLVAGMRGRWFEVPTIVALGGGLRRGEILGLRRGDVDLSTGKVQVQGQIVCYQDGSLEWKAPKTEAGRRTVTLPVEAVEALRQHIRVATEHRMRLGLGAWTDDAYIFTTNGVSPIRPNKLSGDFSILCAKIGLADFSFHGTRHTHATALLKRVGKSGAKAVSQRLGHAGIGVTLDTYQTVFEEDDTELAGLAGGIFGAGGK